MHLFYRSNNFSRDPWKSSCVSVSLLLQQCLACFTRLLWIVFKRGGRCPYNCCFVWCCFQDLFDTARSIFVQLLSSFLIIRLVSVHEVHPDNSILSDRPDFHITSSLSIADQTFTSHVIFSRWDAAYEVSKIVEKMYHFVWRCRLFD